MIAFCYFHRMHSKEVLNVPVRNQEFRVQSIFSLQTAKQMVQLTTFFPYWNFILQNFIYFIQPLFIFSHLLFPQKEMADMRVPRSELGLAMLDGCVYAVGGWEGTSRLDSVEKYDPETNTWVSSIQLAIIFFQQIYPSVMCQALKWL